MAKGIRRVLKVYGPVDPRAEEKRRKYQHKGPVRKPKSGLDVSPKF